MCYTGTIIVGDNCGINDYIYSSGFNQVPALINIFGDNCKIIGGIINGNIWNNKLSINNSDFYVSFGDNDIDKFGYSGINMCGNYGLIDKCTIKNVSWAGVIISPYTESFDYGKIRNTGNTVKRCTISETSRDGIATHLTNDVTISHNYFYNNYWHDIHAYVDTKECKIYKNKIEYKEKLDSSKWYDGCNIVKNTNILISHRQYLNSIVEDIDIYNNMIDSIINNIYIIRCSKNIKIHDNYLITNANTDSDVIIDIEVMNESLEIYRNHFSGCYYGIRFKHNDSITLDNNTNICTFDYKFYDNYFTDTYIGMYLTIRTDTNDNTKPVGNVFENSSIQIFRNAFHNSGNGESCIKWGYGRGITSLTTSVYGNIQSGYQNIYPYGNINTVGDISITDSTTGLIMTFVRNGDYVTANMGSKPTKAMTSDTDYTFSEKLPTELQPRREIYRYTEIRAGRAVRTKITTDGTITVSTDFNVGTSTYAMTDFIYLAKNRN